MEASHCVLNRNQTEIGETEYKKKILILELNVLTSGKTRIYGSRTDLEPLLG